MMGSGDRKGQQDVGLTSSRNNSAVEDLSFCPHMFLPIWVVLSV